MSNRNEKFLGLEQLVRLFHENVGRLGEFTECDRTSVPSPFLELLVHEHHMTVTVESFHQSLVDVEVLKFRSDGTSYFREILLKKQSDQAVVQYGIVKMDGAKLPPEAKRRIESQEIPLGRVLIEDDVMRKVELLAIWKIVPTKHLNQLLEIEDTSETYGRSAVIHVNDEPVIQLLEIVAPPKQSQIDGIR